MLDEVRKKAEELSPRLVEIRRQLHRRPELGFNEKETAALVTDFLREHGLEVQEGVAGTGVVGLLRGGLGGSGSDGTPSGRTIAVRADMDALPVQELSEVEYKSQRDGVMHACGHDAHMSVALGCAAVLAGSKDKIRGNVKFIFQPCEEQPPGGAEPMIAAGVLENPVVDGIIGYHVNPYLPVGFIGVKDGAIMAAADEFSITIKGKGGHAANPHQAVDAILVAAQAVQALQAVASRQVNPTEPVVLSVCSIHGGTTFNVLAEEVQLLGTVRTLNPNLQQRMPGMMRKILDGVTGAYGAAYELDYRFGYPALVNNAELLKVVTETAQEVLGPNKVMHFTAPSMGSEDFACFAEKVPGAYFFLGARPGSGEVFPWHHPKFTIDEQALPVGVSVVTAAVLKALERWKE